MKFTKMNGLRNDYIFINAHVEKITDPSGLAKKLTDEHGSVGGDGIVLIDFCEEADVAMRIYNADGSEGLMCGNALRCTGKYAYENLGIKKERFTVKTASGIKTVIVRIMDGKVVCATADLGEVNGFPQKKKVVFKETEYEGYCVSVGNPHFVLLVDEFPDDLSSVGKFINDSDCFPGGVNVEFALKRICGDVITVRVYERGSGETMACGTGATAAYYVCRNLGFVGNSAIVHLPGGNIICGCKNGNYYINGTVEKNFEGEIEI